MDVLAIERSPMFICCEDADSLRDADEALFDSCDRKGRRCARSMCRWAATGNWSLMAEVGVEAMVVSEVARVVWYRLEYLSLREGSKQCCRKYVAVTHRASSSCGRTLDTRHAATVRSGLLSICHLHFASAPRSTFNRCIPSRKQFYNHARPSKAAAFCTSNVHRRRCG